MTVLILGCVSPRLFINIKKITQEVKATEVTEYNSFPVPEAGLEVESCQN